MEDSDDSLDAEEVQRQFFPSFDSPDSDNKEEVSLLF
jgi:hypothetical protein